MLPNVLSSWRPFGFRHFGSIRKEQRSSSRFGWYYYWPEKAMLKVRPLLQAPFGSRLVSRHLSSATGTTGLATSSSSSSSPSITLYQYAICPFCNKVKALLSYVGVKPQQTIEVNPLTKAELKVLPNKEYRKVPIAMIDGDQTNGSDEIVGRLLDNSYVQSTLQDRWKHVNENDMTIDTFRSSETATRWSNFANDDLAALMYPNPICVSLGASYNTFSYVNDVETFTAVQKAMIKGVGSLAMYLAASKIKKKRGIDDEQEALREAISIWEVEGLDEGEKQFASGLSQPDLGDITVYGTLRSVEGLPAHDTAIERSDVVKGWYQRMQGAMKD